MDDLLSRVQVNKKVIAYIKANNLEDESNHQFITPDKKLSKLFGTSDKFSYLNLQTLMKPLYPPKVTPTTTSAPVNV